MSGGTGQRDPILEMLIISSFYRGTVLTYLKSEGLLPECVEHSSS